MSWHARQQAQPAAALVLSPAAASHLHPVDDPEWHIFYAVSTGVRYTGMPAWNTVLSEEERWKVTGFLSHLQKLPPAVQDYWKKSFGVPPQSGAMDLKQMEGTEKGAKNSTEFPFFSAVSAVKSFRCRKSTAGYRRGREVCAEHAEKDQHKANCVRALGSEGHRSEGHASDDSPARSVKRYNLSLRSARQRLRAPAEGNHGN